MQKKWGKEMSDKLQQRLNELDAVDNLEELATLPGARCHQLVGDRQGQLSVDLAHPYRLIFRPEHDPVPTKPAGGLDWAAVTEVLVLGVEDPH